MDTKNTGQDWRREAMHEALQCRAVDGTPDYTILQALQRHLPDHTARVFMEDRNRALEAFKKRLPDLAPLLTPAYRRDSEEVSAPVLGWWRGACPREGHVYEIILAPDQVGYGDWVVAGSNRDAVLTLADAVVAECSENTSRCQRFTNGSWQDSPEMQTEVERTGWDDIVLSPEQAHDIRKNVDLFFTQKEAFHKFGFAWRRGVLLVGPPGTGKTMVCKAVANAHPEIPFLYVRDLNSHNSRDTLSAIFYQARRLAPCILAIEDIDGLIDRHNRTMFLNELDGFRNNDGILIIASSNHPERIDEALLKRPSRFDRVYHIGLPAADERREYCRRLLARMTAKAGGALPDAHDFVERMAEMTDGFTPAFLKEAILSAMLQRAQDGHPALDEGFAEAALAQVETLRKYLKKAKNPEALADLIGSNGAEIGFRAR